jgi:hypothetical protein
MKSIVLTRRVYDLPYIAECPHLDLRSDPGKIDEIPELRSEPRLNPLVALLNDPGSAFMTHATAIAARKPGIEGETPIQVPYGAKDAPWWYSSYVTFSFWSLNDNSEKNYRVIYERFPERNHYNLAFEIQAAYFLSHFEQQKQRKWRETNGNVCVIWSSGWGATPAEAGSRWNSCIQDLIVFFKALSLDGLTTSNGVTLSEHMFTQSS